MDWSAARGVIKRRPVVAFILCFDERGGTNFGAAGLDEQTAAILHKAGIINVFYYKPYNPRARRRYRQIVAGPHMPRLASLIRQELRARNLAAMQGLNDGLGRVAMLKDRETRSADVNAAVLRAFDTFVAAWED